MKNFDIKDIKNRILISYNFNIKNKKILIGYFIAILICIYLLYVFPISINLETYKSLSSTIVQALASILAIVVALTLVSVQIFSQNYSVKILDIFIKKCYALWALMITYSSAIIYNLITPYALNKLVPLIILVNLSIGLTIVSLLALFPYLIYTIRILQPKGVLDIISKQINEKLITEIVKYNEKNFIAENFTDFNKIPPENDPLIPFIEIIIGAIKNNHTYTAEEGLILLGNLFFDLNENNTINETNGKSVLNYFLEHLKVVKDVAITSKDSQSLGKLTKIAFKIGSSISTKTNDYSALIRSIQDLPESIFEEEFESILNQLICYLQNLLEESINSYDKLRNNQKLKLTIIQSDIYRILNCLNMFWGLSIEKELFNVNQQIQIIMPSIITKLVENGLFGLIKHETFFLMKMGVYMVEKNPEALKEILSTLDSISNELFKNWILNTKIPKKRISFAHNLINNDVLEAIKFIGYESIKKGNYDIEVGNYYSIEEIILLENAIIVLVAKYLRNIAFLYMDKNISKSKLTEEEVENVITKVINYISIFGKDLALNKSDSVIKLIDLLCSIPKNSKSLSKVIKLKIGFKTFYGLRDIFNELIINNSPKIAEAATYINQLNDWVTENDFEFIKSLIISYLGDISLKLVDNKVSTEELQILVKILEEITLDTIKQGKEDYAKESLKQLELLTEKMAKSEFKGKMSSTLEDLEKWLKRFKSSHPNQ